MQDRHVTYREMKASLGISKLLTLTYAETFVYLTSAVRGRVRVGRPTSRWPERRIQRRMMLLEILNL
ncbi:hypothetical protein EVAR_21589_1 [Eumeta japonica]|uniref:Uncharacterized protein n=1 Tax=Eumeta variegata TaxID=151549 RepID=A0A4C1UXC8_EUMVA|nr:hypothetical protein EVAR_21589_1 [Eumeta japonica]